MTVEELKQKLAGTTCPDNVQISPDQIVLEQERFIRTSLYVVENWKGDILKCPEWLRLLKYWDAINPDKEAETPEPTATVQAPAAEEA